MMTKSVNTNAIELLSSAKNSKSNVQKQKSSSDDFGSVMDKTKTNAAKDTNSDTQETKAVNKTRDNDSQKAEDSKPTDNKLSDKKTVDTTDTQVENAQYTSDSESASESEAAVTLVDEELNEILGKNGDINELMDKFKSMLDSLKKTVQDTLGISDEELENAMETLGLTMVDLLNPDNLKQLVLQVSGTEDVSALLTDENLASTLQDLVQKVNDLKTGQDNQLTQEQLAELVNKVQNDTNLPAGNVADTVKATDDESVITSTDTNTQKEVTIEVVKSAETELPKGESHTSDSNSQESNLQQTTALDSFIQNLAVKGNENNLSFADQIANVRQMQDIVNQVVEQIKVVIKPEQSSMEIQLNPENLGKVNLAVVAKDGVMTAQITTQNQLAKEAIESQMHVLKENLNNQGLKVESIEVTVSNFDFDGNSQAAGGEAKGNKSQSQNRQFNPADTDVYTVTDDEDITLENTINVSGSSIDYTA